MKSKYNYTFKDILDYLYEANTVLWTSGGSGIIKEIFESELSLVVKQSFKEIGSVNESGILTYADYVSDVIDNVWRLHFENYCVFIDDVSQLDYEAHMFLMKFLTLLNQTALRYKSILGAYNTQKTRLLDKLSSTNNGMAKFNDTPQGSGDYSDDTHTSNITITSNTNEVEIKTPIERLKEIQDEFSDVLAKWSEEFNNLFLEEGNLAYEN